jgi:asparagine N-glycosylation enzyme membrane subunit Stt3
MKNTTFRLNSILTIILGIVLFAGILLRVFAPIVMLPKLDIPNIVLISLVALLVDHYVSKEHTRHYVWVFVLSVLAFALLPWVAGFVNGVAVLKTAVVGGVVFTAAAWMFSSSICFFPY